MVLRFEPKDVASGRYTEAVPEPEGRFVEYSDYAELEAQLAETQEKLIEANNRPIQKNEAQLAARTGGVKSGDAQAIANRLRSFFREPGDARRLALDAAMMIEYLNKQSTVLSPAPEAQQEILSGYGEYTPITVKSSTASFTRPAEQWPANLHVWIFRD